MLETSMHYLDQKSPAELHQGGNQHQGLAVLGAGQSHDHVLAEHVPMHPLMPRLRLQSLAGHQDPAHAQLL